MKRIKNVAVFLSLIICSHLAVGQDSLLLYNRIKERTEKNEPTWTLERRAIFENYLVLRWGAEQKRVLAYITTAPTDELAVKLFNESFTELNRGTWAKKQRTELKDFGNQNSLWAETKQQPQACLLLRQEKTVIQVFAPTIDLAKRFATDIREEIIKMKATPA